MVTVTGWTFEEIDAMSMGDAVDLFEYWRDYPPAHVILRAVYMKPGAEPQRSSRKQDISEAETVRALLEMQSLSGSALGSSRQMPPHLKELADYAEETLAKMKLN